MAQQAQPTPPADKGWVAGGGVVFAGVLMLVNGILAIFEGISAIATDDVWAHIGTYVYRVSLTGWGVIVLILGIIAVFTGAGILKGLEWARVVGIILASLTLIAHFLFLPYAPVWSFIMILIDGFVIWALATAHDMRPVNQP